MMRNHNDAKISPQLASQLNKPTSQSIRILILVKESYNEPDKVEDVETGIERIGISLLSEIPDDLGIVVAEATPTQVRQLAKESWVEQIQEDQSIYPIFES